MAIRDEVDRLSNQDCQKEKEEELISTRPSVIDRRSLTKKGIGKLARWTIDPTYVGFIPVPAKVEMHESDCRGRRVRVSYGKRIQRERQKQQLDQLSTFCH
jgi:hypothetical protein